MKQRLTEQYFVLSYDLRRNNSARSRSALEHLYNQAQGNHKLQSAIAETLVGEYKKKGVGG